MQHVQPVAAEAGPAPTAAAHAAVASSSSAPGSQAAAGTGSSNTEAPAQQVRLGGLENGVLVSMPGNGWAEDAICAVEECKGSLPATRQLTVT